MHKQIHTHHASQANYTNAICFQVPAASNWTESLKVTRTGDRLWIDAYEALNRFKAWLEVVTGLPDYDHAMAFTGYVKYVGQGQDYGV